MKVLFFESINSTNTFLKENYQSLENYTVVLTNHQTDGRGRTGRTWYDDEGSALFSFLVKNITYIDDTPYLNDYCEISFFPLVSVYATAKELEKYHDKVLIKWPNDIMINDKKISGMLVEAVTNENVEAVFTGIGININNKAFNESVKEKASSLYIQTKRKFDIKTIVFNICETLYSIIEEKKISKEDVIKYLNEHSYLKGKEVSFIYQGNKEKGLVEKIDEKGQLIINCENRQILLYYGEVTLESVYGR